jgi:hypothetical protein
MRTHKRYQMDSKTRLVEEETQNLKICDTDRKIKRQGLLEWPTSDNKRSGISKDYVAEPTVIILEPMDHLDQELDYPRRTTEQGWQYRVLFNRVLFGF